MAEFELVAKVKADLTQFKRQMKQVTDTSVQVKQLQNKFSMGGEDKKLLKQLQEIKQAKAQTDELKKLKGKFLSGNAGLLKIFGKMLIGIGVIAAGITFLAAASPKLQIALDRLIKTFLLFFRPVGDELAKLVNLLTKTFRTTQKRLREGGTLSGGPKIGTDQPSALQMLTDPSLYENLDPSSPMAKAQKANAEMVQGWRDSLTGLIDFVTDTFIPQVLRGWDILWVGVGKGWEKLKSMLISGWTSLANILGSIWDQFLDAIDKIFESVFGTGLSDTISNFINTARQTILTFIDEAVGKVMEFLSAIDIFKTLGPVIDKLAQFQTGIRQQRLGAMEERLPKGRNRFDLLDIPGAQSQTSAGQHPNQQQAVNVAINIPGFIDASSDAVKNLARALGEEFERKMRELGIPA